MSFTPFSVEDMPGQVPTCPSLFLVGRWVCHTLDCVQGTQRVFGLREYLYKRTVYICTARLLWRACVLSCASRVVNGRETGRPIACLFLRPSLLLGSSLTLRSLASWSNHVFIYAVIFISLPYTPTERRNTGVYGTERRYSSSVSTIKDAV